MIYFDNAASAMPRKEAVDAFNAVLAENFSNPAALHKGGIESEKIITKSREAILSHLPKGGRLLFTSGATESNNLAIMNSVKPRNKNKIVTTAIEHPSVSGVMDKLSEAYEIVRVLPHEEIAAAVDENTCLVSMTAACGETGFIINTAKIYAEIKARFPDCIVHVDGVQSFLKLPINDMDGDLISLSSHKIGGIPGVGGLFVKDTARINPMMFGGGQQKGTRPGTEPAALIAAFGKAQDLGFRIEGRLNERLVDGLEGLGLKINSRNNIPHIVNFSCGVKSEVMLHFLAEHLVYVSSGSACARGKKSRILPAYAIPDRDIDTAIRVSFGWQNTIEEVDEFLNILEAGLKRWK